MTNEDNIQNKIGALTDNMISCMKIHEELDKKLVKRIRLMPEIKKNFDFVAKNETSVESEYFCAGFVEGTDWRINSIWHDASEHPIIGEEALLKYITGDGEIKYRVDVFCGYEWKEMCHYDKLIQFAYVKDLIPNMEDKA